MKIRARMRRGGTQLRQAGVVNSRWLARHYADEHSMVLNLDIERLPRSTDR